MDNPPYVCDRRSWLAPIRKESTTNGLVMPLAGQSVLPQSLAFQTSEIAELADVYFFHPLGSVIARLAKFLGLTPTQVTVISALVGVAGGALLYDKNLGLVAFAILILHGIIDAADGQLARLTGQVTELGKVLDGGAGYVTHAAIYLAIATGEFHRSGGSLIFLWMILAGISTALHAQMYDYHRTQYSSIVSKGVLSRQDPARVGSRASPALSRIFGDAGIPDWVARQRWMRPSQGVPLVALCSPKIA